MDIPVNLMSGKFVTGMDEFKNTLYVLLKNHKGSFVQSGRVGTTLDVHVQEPEVISEALRSCVEQIANCTLTHCDVDINGRSVTCHMVCTYNGDVVNFVYEYENEI